MKRVHPRWKTVTTGSEAPDFSMTEKAEKRHPDVPRKPGPSLGERRALSFDLPRRLFLHNTPCGLIFHSSHSLRRKLCVCQGDNCQSDKKKKEREKMWQNQTICNDEFFFVLLRSKNFGLSKKTETHSIRVCEEVKQKNADLRVHPPHFTHTHTNTPFRYLLWSELSHLRKRKKKKKGQKFEQEAWKQSSNNSLTQWYIVVFGGRYWNGAWDLQPCPFCLTCCTFHLKSEGWDFKSVPDVKQDAWLFFFILEDVMKHYTLPAAVTPSKTLRNVHSFFSPPNLCTTWKNTACLLHVQFQ